MENSVHKQENESMIYLIVGGNGLINFFAKIFDQSANCKIAK